MKYGKNVRIQSCSFQKDLQILSRTVSEKDIFFLFQFQNIRLKFNTEKNISEFFLFFIGTLPQGVDNRKTCYLKRSIYYCESEIRG